MKLFFAGAEPRINIEVMLKVKVKNYLFSFYYVKEKEWATKPNSKLVEVKKAGGCIFLDSGGFSAITANAIISVEDYAKFLKVNKDYIDFYANLDDKDIKTSLKNQAYLEKQGLSPIPVFHWFELKAGMTNIYDKYLKNYKYVAIGGIANIKINNDEKKYYLDYCVKKAIKADVKLHGFGLTSKRELLRYPFYSVDSTSWNQGMYGVITRWDSKNLKFVNSHYTKNKKTLESKVSIAQINHYKKRAEYNLKQYLKMEKLITRIWEARGIKY